MIKEEDLRFIRLVNELAESSAQQGFDAFGALLVCEGEIRSSSMDQCIKYSDPTAHAELVVISEYCRQHRLISLEGYTLYCNVEPCIMCSGAIHWAKISRVVYGVRQQQLQAKSKGKPKPGCEDLINCGGKRIEIIGPVLEEEGIAILNKYPFISKQKRHQEYYGSRN